MVQYFISYSRENQQVVERIRDDLQNSGLNIWIDKVGLQPGTPDWDDALRIAIRESEAVLLVASPNSRRSPYVRDEIALARAAKKAIYPIWVDGEVWIDSIPMGLGSTQNVDLRNDNYSVNLQLLIATLRGQETEIVPVSPEPEKAIPIVKNPRNPYKGLKSFRADDEKDFFGRDELIENLLSLIDNSEHQARFLAILGASGSGKSSVMMAGVLPRLREQNPNLVFLDTIVPGNDPLDKLTITLARQLIGRSHTAIRQDLMNRDTNGLNLLTRELSDTAVVLYIDQFEEIFTQVENEADRRHFIDLITTATTNPNGVLYVLLSMRADFYDRPAKYRNFGPLIEKHHALVTPMSLADLFDAVQKPAELDDVGMTFDEGLVTDMVFSVRAESASLPLLQFTLDQLFERRDGNRLTMASYRKLGGVKGALAQHAEDTFQALPSEQHKTLARALFLRLIEPGNTALDTTRRRATYEELTTDNPQQTRILKEVADIFVDARLLVGDIAGSKRTIEVSHEALIREWERLSEWLYNSREDLQTQRSLSIDVAEWQRRGNPDDMFYRGTILETAQDWAERNPASRDERAFINQSAEAEIARIAHEARNARNLRYMLIGLVAVIVLASVGLAVIFAQNNASLQEEAQTLEAQAGDSLALASTAEIQATSAEENRVAAEAAAIQARDESDNANTQIAVADTQIADGNQRSYNAATQAANAETQAAQAIGIADRAATQAVDAEIQANNAETQAFDSERQAADAETLAADAELQAANAETQAFDAERQAANAATQEAEANSLLNEVSTQVSSANEQSTQVRQAIEAAEEQATGVLGVLQTADAQVAATSTQQSNLLNTVVAQTQIAFDMTATMEANLQNTAVAQTQIVNATATSFALLPNELAQNGVTSNEEWTPVERDFDGATMVLVPAGCFTLGSSNNASDELSGGEVCFDEPFWIDKFEVTNEQYGATDCPNTSSDPDEPRVCVAWTEAQSYCEAHNANLPTEEQWEYAARGPSGLIYPWGDTFSAENVTDSISSVGSKPNGASWVGALDMSGNVREWTNSLYLSYSQDRVIIDDIGRLTELVLRGGTFTGDADALRASNRTAVVAPSRIATNGFRCVRDF